MDLLTLLPRPRPNPSASREEVKSVLVMILCLDRASYRDTGINKGARDLHATDGSGGLGKGEDSSGVEKRGLTFFLVVYLAKIPTVVLLIIKSPCMACHGSYSLHLYRV